MEQLTLLAAQTEEARLACTLPEFSIEHAAILTEEGAAAVVGDQHWRLASVRRAAANLLVLIGDSAGAVAEVSSPARTQPGDCQGKAWNH